MTKTILVLMVVALSSQSSFAGCFFGPSLKEAVKAGDASRVDALIRKGKNVNQKMGEDKDSLLNVACYNLDKGTQFKEIALALIHAGADVNALNKLNVAPLSRAAYNGDLDLVKELVEKGADVNRGDFPSLCKAAANGSEEVVRYLIENGADLHKKNLVGETPLFIASQRGHVKVVKILLASGAQSDIDTPERYMHTTPLAGAVEYGHTLTVRALLEAGADPYKRDKKGHSPIQIAAMKGFDDIVGELQAAGVRVQAADLRSAVQAPSANGNSSHLAQDLSTVVHVGVNGVKASQALGQFLGSF